MTSPAPLPGSSVTATLVGAAFAIFLFSPLAPRSFARDDGEPRRLRGDLSLKLEIEHAIDRGIRWLLEHQDPEIGAWGEPDHPALTALAVCALAGAPSFDPGAPPPAPLKKGIAFLLDRQQTDGGIYSRSLATYNTSLSLLALSQAGGPECEPAITAARRFLISQQADFARPGVPDDPLDGGIGYGGTHVHSDLSNTHFAIEALYYSRDRLADTGARSDKEPGADLNWEAAIRFVERCQNLPESNDQEWTSGDPADRGGFIYYPGDSKAGTRTLADGRKVPRSYGSMSYAGLLSFIYADVDRNDARVTAALDWLRAHYTVEENPGMEHEGLYYYYHTMAKALSLSEIDQLEVEGGRQADWRLDLARKLFDLQQSDGSWVNQTGRWWEKDPVLVTAYALLSLEHIHHGL